MWFFWYSISSLLSSWIQCDTGKSINGDRWQTHFCGQNMCASSHVFTSLLSPTTTFFRKEKILKERTLKDIKLIYLCICCALSTFNGRNELQFEYLNYVKVQSYLKGICFNDWAKQKKWQYRNSDSLKSFEHSTITRKYIVRQTFDKKNMLMYISTYSHFPTIMLNKLYPNSAHESPRMKLTLNLEITKRSCKFDSFEYLYIHLTRARINEKDIGQFSFFHFHP